MVCKQVHVMDVHCICYLLLGLHVLCTIVHKLFGVHCTVHNFNLSKLKSDLLKKTNFVILLRLEEFNA